MTCAKTFKNWCMCVEANSGHSLRHSVYVQSAISKTENNQYAVNADILRPRPQPLRLVKAKVRRPSRAQSSVISYFSFTLTNVHT